MTKFSRMVTWHQCACSFYKPTIIITFDEAPMAFNAGFVRQMVLFDGEQAENWVPAAETKRMFTLIAPIAYEVETKKVLFLRPICIFKGKHKPSDDETKKYSKEVDVFFQEKAVVDSTLMLNSILPTLRRQTSEHKRAFVLDSARQHLTRKVLQDMNKNGDFHTRVEEGTTCWCQLADLYIFFLFKHYYKAEFAVVDGKRTSPRFSASEKRTAVTSMVATTWKNVEAKLNCKLAKAFEELGLIPGTTPSQVMPFPLRPYKFQYTPIHGIVHVHQSTVFFCSPEAVLF